MKKMLIAGNWKMNKTEKEAWDLTTSIIAGVTELSGELPKILICPPFTSINIALRAAKHSNILVGAQNCHFEEKGAFTGEISPQMLVCAGCSYVITGHSERRTYFNETDELINKKSHAVLKVGLIPIICIGETLAHRQEGKTFEVLSAQLAGCLAGLTPSDAEKTVIAYEPVWAIGTGLAATPTQIEEAHSYIRKELEPVFGANANDAAILYGGSLTADNADETLSIADVNGGLIGGASLKSDVFIKIIQISQKYI